MKTGSLAKCQFVDIQRFNDDRGALGVVQNDRALIPFEINRLYYIADVADGAMRAGHGHKRLEQLFIALHGQCSLNLYDGYDCKTVKLNDKFRGFYVTNNIWRTLDQFSEGAVIAVLASRLYEQDDYLYSLDEFEKYIWEGEGK